VSAGETLPDVVLAAASAVGCPADVTQRSALTADELTGTPGGRPVTRVLDQAGYLEALRAKVVEEAEEAQAAPDRQLQSELADVLEVLRALAAAHGVSWEDVVAEATRKRRERGGFDQRIFLEYVDQVG